MHCKFKLKPNEEWYGADKAIVSGSLPRSSMGKKKARKTFTEQKRSVGILS